MKRNWWKVLGILLLLYALPMAWLGEVSVQNILNETIRNLYFHVTMWFAMFLLFIGSLVNSIRYLRTGNWLHDNQAVSLSGTGLVFGWIGIFTGMIWATFTWGKPWVVEDPQLNGAAITVLAYVAYFVLRGSIPDPDKKARISAVYNIFAFTLMFILIGIMPRLQDSTHPGKGGDPGFGAYDKDSLIGTMRPVFYAAIIGWTLIGAWMSQIYSRIRFIKHTLHEKHP